MPRPAKPSKPDIDYQLAVRIPGWLKNQIIEIAATQNIGLNEWVALQIYIAAREQKGLPTKPTGRPLPTTADHIRHYLAGENILMPCGKTTCNYQPEHIGNTEFCQTCGIRTQ